MLSTTQLPSHTAVLIVGGGPAGAYCAAALAREGIQATVIEAAKFPRYHIGESMLPSIGPFLRFIGAEEKFRARRFCVKPGAAVKFNQHKREGYTDFVATNPDNGAWNVVRSEFDDMLLRHAEECGAGVFEQTKVSEIDFVNSGQDNLRPTSAQFARRTGERGSISFDYLVDASGRSGIMSTKYLKNRTMNRSLHNIACWAYWTGQKRYMPGTRRENAPWFESLADRSGWGWFIPLHNGTVSVGIVMDSSISISKKAAGRTKSDDDEYSLKAHYLDQLQFVPGLKDLLDGATLKEDGEDYFVRSASDFSYAADRYAGDHFRLVGDASAFIDPFFSSGVHLALLGGLSAATSISASIRKHCSEIDAAGFHDIKVSTAYTRFLLVVMSAYKQIRSQTVDVLADVDEDNFDRAFDILRPVIQGTADVGKKLTEDELQKTMDFCKDIFAPTDPEMHEAVGARIQPELISPSQPILTDEEIARAVDPGDEDAKLVLHRVNARKPLDAMYKGPSNLQAENVNGFIAHLQRGRLGLIRSSLWKPSEPGVLAEVNRAVASAEERFVSAQA